MWNGHQNSDRLMLPLTFPKPRQKGLYRWLKPPRFSVSSYLYGESQPRKSVVSADGRERRQDDCRKLRLPTGASIAGDWGHLQTCQADTYFSNRQFMNIFGSPTCVSWINKVVACVTGNRRESSYCIFWKIAWPWGQFISGGKTQ